MFSSLTYRVGANLYLSQHMVLERKYSSLTYRVSASLHILVTTHGAGKELQCIAQGWYLNSNYPNPRNKTPWGFLVGRGGWIDKIAKTLNYRKFRSIDENTKQFAYQCLN